MNFTLNYTELWKQLLPPVLRKIKQLAWGTVLLQPLQSLHDFIFGEYSNGANYPIFSNTGSPPTVYNPGDRVIYIDRGVYECILTTTSGQIPTDTTYWTLVNINYIGIRERVLYNSRKILFEYALNKWFVCAGIYITYNTLTSATMLLSNDSIYSSVLVNNSVFAINYLSNAYIVTSQYQFTINVPLAVFNGLSTIPAQRELIIRSFADRMVIAGMQYNVVTY